MLIRSSPENPKYSDRSAMKNKLLMLRHHLAGFLFDLFILTINFISCPSEHVLVDDGIPRS